MHDIILYSYNDMSGFVTAGISEIDPLSTVLINILHSLLGPILTNNVFVLLSVLFSFISAYVLFKYIKNTLIKCIFSLLYSLSVYFLFRLISLTPGLYFVFFFPIIFILLHEEVRAVFLGVFTLFVLVFSTYYGFYILVLIFLWYVFSFFFKKIFFKEFIANTSALLIPVIIGVLIFFSSTLINNLPVFGKYKKPTNQEKSAGVYRVYRPLEDFYNLSFRPWYFFIPPKSSVFFGEFSKNIHEKIKNTGYYLADDYMEEEMAGSYMGWHFLFGLGTVAVLLLLKKYKNIEFKTFKTVYENKEMILKSFFIIFCILLISGPPSFTIGGVEIYTPTYLLYYIVPVFRTLVRWAVVIYLFVLIINSFLVQDLYNLMKTKLQKILFILSFLTLNFVIFAIKIPVININKPPQEIAFVKEKYPGSVPYAVYPKGDYYSIFWIISHEDLLINPVNYVNYEIGFDSNEFSKKLITEDGIQEFLNQNPKYLIYYPENISNDDLEKIGKTNPNLSSKEDIYEFFKSKFGDGVVVGESVIFNVGD